MDGRGEEPGGRCAEVHRKNKPSSAPSSIVSNLQDSSMGSFEESEEVLMATDDATKPPAESNSSFRFTYLGTSLVDRRYTQSMLPWVISEVKRRKERVHVDLNVELMTVKARDKSNVLIFEHRVHIITRCARSIDKKCFAYLTKSSADNCYCYVFEAHDITSVPGFLGCIKQAAKQQAGDDFKCKNSEDMTPAMAHEVVQTPAVKHTLWYVGKVVSRKHAPPTLIDDSVLRFKNGRRAVETERDSKNLEKKESTGRKSSIIRQSSPTTVSKRTHTKAYKSQSLDSGMISSGVSRTKAPLAPPKVTAAHSRPRSASDGDQNKMHFGSKDDGQPRSFLKAHTRAASFGNEVENRNVMFQITGCSVTIIGLVSKVVLMEKKLRDISFCQQGSANADHFGFICHEAKMSQHVCYVFKGQSENLVNNVMRSFKQAFQIAWQATGPTSVCEMCPLHHLHQLCVQLEGLSSSRQHEILQKHLVNLSEDERNEFTDKCQVEGPFQNADDENEVIMAILRGLYEKRQQNHTHTLLTHPMKDSLKAGGSGLLQKARKSFDSLMSRGRSRTAIRGEEECIGEDTVLRRNRSSTLEGFLNPNKVTPPMSPIEEKSPKNQGVTSLSSLNSSIKSALPAPEDKSSDNQSDASVGLMPSPPSSPTKTSIGRIRRSSYRQVIFHSVVAPTKRTSVSSHEGDVTSHADMEMSRSPRRTSDELQALWRKVIGEQILLNRMEKENKRLKVYQDVSELRRLKLNYDEVFVCSSAVSDLWDHILASKDGVVDRETLGEAVKAGVSRVKRGDVWKFLINQNQLQTSSKGSLAWNSASYSELKNGLSNQQHSIFIDLGRTFPSHPYFATQLGHGQICLFNILKAYSVLDKAVGYCQGLSFVAGLLLMHLDEEEAFDALRHLMYALGARKQYKPDMQELQIQFYKLSRLLHDYHKMLYDCLEDLKISPTLYAAPWFLTIFASHFPVGFVVRVMDLIFFDGMDVVFKIILVLLSKCQDDILAADGFEGVVEYMKTVLPVFAVQNTELIVAEAFKMDISKELESYKVEYQVFKEESMSACSFEELESERIACLEAEKTILSRQVQDLTENLSCTRNTVENLEESITALQMNQSQLLNIIHSLREENSRFKAQLDRHHKECATRTHNQHADQHGAGLVPAMHASRSAQGGSRELNTSFTEDNTDSYEHIDENDITDDEAESISRDSPANGLSDVGTGSPSPPLTDKVYDLTVSR